MSQGKEFGISFTGTVDELRQTLKAAERVLDEVTIETLEEELALLAQENRRLREALQDIANKVDHGPAWIEDKARKALL